MQENGSVNVNGMSSDQSSSDQPRMAIEPSAVTECRPPASADIFPGVGFRIRREIARLPYDAYEMFKDFELADISDHLNRLYTIDPTIRCLAGNSKRLAGTALTVKG